MFLFLMMMVAIFYITYKIYKKYLSNSEIEDVMDQANDLHKKAEKAKTVDIKQYKKDKQVIDKLKNID